MKRNRLQKKYIILIAVILIVSALLMLALASRSGGIGNGMPEQTMAVLFIFLALLPIMLISFLIVMYLSNR